VRKLIVALALAIVATPAMATTTHRVTQACDGDTPERCVTLAKDTLLIYVAQADYVLYVHIPDDKTLYYVNREDVDELDQ
jgi:hypothetical protein